MKLGTLVYLKNRGRTLMIHRVKKEGDIHWGKWNTLGGKFEPGETPEECAVREVLEESGLYISKPELKGVLTFPAFDGVEDWYVFVMVAHEFQGELLEDSPEGRLEWIDDAELEALELWEGDRIFMKWLDTDGFFSGKLVYDNGGLVSHNVTFHGGSG
jgi:8-oxo-dGTP diphosphatase